MSFKTFYEDESEMSPEEAYRHVLEHGFENASSDIQENALQYMKDNPESGLNYAYKHSFKNTNRKIKTTKKHFFIFSLHFYKKFTKQRYEEECEKEIC